MNEGPDAFEDVDFTNIPPELAEIAKQHSLETNPHRRERKGKISAEPVLETNRITDSGAIDAVLKTALDFRDFQELALYHDNGYYENIGDYQKAMPMLPQLLSPLFGKAIGELAFANYMQAAWQSIQKPAFLSIGAGRGFLDHDLIEHLSGDIFLTMTPEYHRYAEVMNKHSTFMITDRRENALSFLQEELSDILKNPNLKDRVQIEQLDVLDFELDKKPFGIIYSNELIDCLPTEPIVSINGELYAVKVLSYNLSGVGEGTTYTKRIEEKLPSIKGIISKEQVKARIDAGETDNLGFAPVFIPLYHDQYLLEQFGEFGNINGVNEEKFGGVYPLHLGVDNVIKNITNSFEHGAILMIDYVTHAEGMHNWNIAVNHLKHYRFGKEDVDFQIDSKQVMKRAEPYAMEYQTIINLHPILRNAMPILQFAPDDAAKRWSQAQGMPFSGQEEAMGMMMAYSVLTEMAKDYDIIILHF